MTTKHAYGLLQIKAMSDDGRVLEGTATTPTPDRLGDIIEPKGAVFSLPIPLLWQHDAHAPIGEVFAAKVGKDGIEVKARIRESGGVSTRLQDRLDEAWESVKKKLVRGFSIGFSPRETSAIEGTYSYRYIEWEWLELSLVTIPANADATIATVKSIDQAASGRQVVRLDQNLLRRARRETRPGVVYL